jgi:hypothetical protein
MTTIKAAPLECPDCGAEMQVVQDGDPRLGPTQSVHRCPWTTMRSRLTMERRLVGRGSIDVWACGNPYNRSTRRL